ncbi:HXXEE motif-containing protein [Gemmatirosa kalamazoonensis]|uniref:HXXEE motif-containing protein n=1 Tax=Gemmatirosa kalamazoonensis TaxID=861299 RepID=W0RHM8_9BACT|nr:HXXEE domain-containing protein [Gemmatirosa kalamazoonensis]AHG88908.1 HXXEE motif-containing protein [Gemmatirosa kalamazoonensis]
MPRRPPLRILAALVPLHNAEEALTFGHYLPAVRARVPPVLAPLAASITERQLLVALGAATVVPVAVVLWAERRPRSGGARWLALLVAAVLLVNVASHVAAAVVVLRGYSPGLVTALALNLPGCAWLLWRAARERWVSPGAFAALLPAAFVVHGPLLLGLIALAGR